MLYITKFLLLILLLVPSSFANDQITTTVIDILSENVEFSYFLRLLQRNQLVPYLNLLSNFTLIAPVNSAFAACFQAHNESCDFKPSDLHRYIIDGQISSQDVDGVQIFSTVHDDSMRMTSSPVMFKSNDHSFEIEGHDVVEPDLIADTQLAYVQGIESFLPRLKPLNQTLSEIKHTDTFNRLLRSGKLTGKTVFLPMDNSFEFEDYELHYLFTKEGEQDSQLIRNGLIVEGIYGGNINETVTDGNGHQVSITSVKDGELMKLNNSLVSIESNILATDGIIHLFSTSALIEEVDFNPMKALIGLDATDFVEELVLQGLSDLILNNSIEQTIFYPKDSSQLVSIQSKSSNLYHFVDERIESLDDIKSLYYTKFCNTKKLGSSCQRLKAGTFGDQSTVILNNNVLIESGPFNVGNTSIYLTDDDLRTPLDLIPSVNSVFHCTKSLSYIEDLGLAKLSNNHQGYTVLLPCFDSWDDFALTANYLEQNKTALEFILKNLILEGLIYTDINADEHLNLTNLNGEIADVQLLSKKDSILEIEYNGINLGLKKDRDVLYNQGVIHPIDQIFLPKNIDISLEDIIMASDAEVFLKFLKFFPELNDLMLNKSYSILLPSAHSLLKMPTFDSNSTLKEFLQLHFIKQDSLKDLFECNDNILQTLNPHANLTCTKLSGKTGNSFLQIDNGADNGVRILNKGCTSRSPFSCVYSIDKPISLKWIDEENPHYHINLPAIAVLLGMIIGCFSMIAVLVCLMMVVVRRKKASSNTNDGEANNDSNNSGADERTSLLGSGDDTDYQSSQRNGGGAFNSFENNYSSNTSVDPIALNRKKFTHKG